MAGSTVPPVAVNENECPLSNTLITAPALLWLRSSVTVLEPPTGIVVGLAERDTTAFGLDVTGPATPLQPAVPGPALQPHQLFVASIADGVPLFTPAVTS